MQIYLFMRLCFSCFLCFCLHDILRRHLTSVCTAVGLRYSGGVSDSASASARQPAAWCAMAQGSESAASPQASQVSLPF